MSERAASPEVRAPGVAPPLRGGGRCDGTAAMEGDGSKGGGGGKTRCPLGFAFPVENIYTLNFFFFFFFPAEYNWFM